MASRPNHTINVDTRLSKLETIIDGISATLEKIQNKLDNESKINWTPIGLGITVIFAIVGSFSTIYVTRMNAADSKISINMDAVQALVVASTEQRITLQTVKDRQEDFKAQATVRIDNLEIKTDKFADRLRVLEGLNPEIIRTNRDEADTR